MVNFKIEPCSFKHKFIVCKGLMRPFILGKEFLSHHCFTLGWTNNNKRFAEYRNKVIPVTSQAVMDERIMVSHPVKIPVRNFAMVPTKCPNMFSGRVEVWLCPEFKNKFPNIYLEPMQYDNSDGKWQDVIPYMIINLDYDRDIYISKDTVAHEEDKSCEYLEVNEVIESTEFRNWTPRQRQSIVDSDLGFSSTGDKASLCRAEGSRYFTKKTKDRFEILKKKYPKVFSLSSQDIGCTNLVTMHVDTGDSPAICQ